MTQMLAIQNQKESLTRKTVLNPEMSNMIQPAPNSGMLCQSRGILNLYFVMQWITLPGTTTSSQLIRVPLKFSTNLFVLILVATALSLLPNILRVQMHVCWGIILQIIRMSAGHLSWECTPKFGSMCTAGPPVIGNIQFLVRYRTSSWNTKSNLGDCPMTSRHKSGRFGGSNSLK
ncbi:hypothetical protein B0H13DRAFT_2282459 [Mycena leptocephala]|nr:hypothetical protein B0H13DRAFT_2282459 [Mycena leptocephala]